jgi:uncharacterized membrane protein
MLCRSARGHSREEKTEQTVEREISARASIHIPKTTGERAADVVAAAMGSWRFIIIQSVIVAAWIILNIMVIVRHFDPYPFILLNLLFSTQAAYAAPIIMMSQNRQAAKDRQRDDHEAVTVDETADIVALTHENTTEIQRLAREQAEILAAQDQVLAQQTEMLTLLREHTARPEESRGQERPVCSSPPPTTMPARRSGSSDDEG